MQQRRMQAFADQRGLEVEMLDPELDVSGAEVSRPVLDDAIARIKRGEAEGLIVATLDRLSRMNIIDALRTIEGIEAAGGQVIAVAENFDPTTVEGKMVRNIHLSIGEAQRGRYAEHISGSKRQAVERGIWPMPVVPRGYTKGQDRRLVIDPETAPAVRRAFELRAAGESWARLAEMLGCGHSGATKIIRNRVYLGEIRLLVDEDEVVNLKAHEHLVSRELWEAAQISHPRPPRGKRGPALLAGLVRCASCSRLMSPGSGIYRCFPRKASGNCPAPATIQADSLEPYVEGIALRELRSMAVDEHPLDSAEAERKALTEAEDQLKRWQETVDLADVGTEFAAGKLRQLVEEVKAARKALGRAQAASGVAVAGRSALKAYKGLRVKGRRHVLGRAISVVWVGKGRGLDGRVVVVTAGSEPADLSGPGRPAPPIAVDLANVEGAIAPLETEGLGEAERKP